MAVFADERVGGEECAQRATFLKSKKRAVSENHLPDASGQAFQTQSVLKSPLERPEPHVHGRNFDAPHSRAGYRDMSRCPPVLLAHGS